MKDVLDFIVIGAQKSATTTLFEHLRRHPDVALPVAKEVPFFSHDEIYRRGWDLYIDELTGEGPMSDPGKLWGTVTPQYMMGGVLKPLHGVEPGAYNEQTVPRRIQAQLPEVRLIAILRDPVQRAISHHSMAQRRGGERRTIDAAVEELLRPEQLLASRVAPTDINSYITWGEYGRILGGYLDVFARERLLVLFTEQLEQSPLDLLATLYRFIGASEDFVPENADGRYFVARNEAGFEWRRPGTWMSPSSPVSPQGLQRGVRRVGGARALWRALPFETRQRMWRAYSGAATRARASNRRRTAPEAAAQAPPRPETIESLRAHFADDLPRLTATLGETPPWARGAP
jgi:Sulfotransferase domain